MLKRLFIAALLLPGAAWAADGTIAVTPGSGATIVTSPDGSGNQVPHSIPCDRTTPTPITNGTVTGIAVSATADTTNGCLKLGVETPTTNTDTWNDVAQVTTVEVQ
jgi:hypothetical protein